MKEEKNDVSKTKWRQIFRKKWFFPAVYIAIAAVLLTVVIWYQSLDNRLPEVLNDDQEVISDQYSPTDPDGDVEAVMDQQEVIQMPISDEDQAEIVTKYYDYNADEEDQENALVFQDNHYYQSTGIDIASVDGETFDVQASLSGTVADTKVDPILGNIVILEHEQNVMTYYASLGEVFVEAGDKVTQGDVIGNAGNNIIGKDNGTHVHFEIRKDDVTFNPEDYFNQPISKLEIVDEGDSHEVDQMDEEANQED